MDTLVIQLVCNVAIIWRAHKRVGHLSVQIDRKVLGEINTVDPSRSLKILIHFIMSLLTKQPSW